MTFGWFGWLVWLAGLVGLVGLVGSFIAMRFIGDCHCQSSKKSLFWCRPPDCTEKGFFFLKMLAASCWVGWFVWLVGLVDWLLVLVGLVGLVGCFGWLLWMVG